MPQALADQGVLFTDFHTALEEIPQVVEDYFMSSVKYDDDKLAAYHTAYFNSGGCPLCSRQRRNFRTNRRYFLPG